MPSPLIFGNQVAMMKIKYAVSLWNYTHYTNAPDLEGICAQLREQGYGIELWSGYGGLDGEELYNAAGSKRLKAALQGMPVSLHSDIYARSFDGHQKQIDTAAQVGADVIVIHADNIYLPDSKVLDESLANRVVAYAAGCGVTIALENGQLPFLTETINKVEGLKFCLDTGHVYLTQYSMQEFLTALKHKIAHLHIQEVLSEPEKTLVGNYGIIYDHYIPGTGGIAASDWQKLISALQEIDFSGTAVFEIHPRDPLQTAFLGSQFIQNITR